MFIPKEQNFHTISQLRNTALLNVEGKIIFSILARRMSNFLMGNRYINTSCQKAGITGFPGCIEHSSVIWDQILPEKREKSDLHVVWLDFTNTYGSVLPKLIEFVMEFFYVPGCVQNIITVYFGNLHMCSTLEDYTTGWQQLECGIAMVCEIFPFYLF